MLQPFGFDNDGASRFSIEGADVRLEPKAALTFAMVLHELATNAAKYGALSTPGAGQVPDRLGARRRREGRPDAASRWLESGGPPVSPSGGKGFGSRLIEGALAHELAGEVRISYGLTGVTCQIDMPLPLGFE